MFARESGGRSCTRNDTQPQIYVRPKPEKNEDTPTVCRVAKTPFSYTTQNTIKLKNQRFRFRPFCTTPILITHLSGTNNCLHQTHQIITTYAPLHSRDTRFPVLYPVSWLNALTKQHTSGCILRESTDISALFAVVNCVFSFYYFSIPKIEYR